MDGLWDEVERGMGWAVSGNDTDTGRGVESDGRDDVGDTRG